MMLYFCIRYTGSIVLRVRDKGMLMMSKSVMVIPSISLCEIKIIIAEGETIVALFSSAVLHLAVLSMRTIVINNDRCCLRYRFPI